jgi:ATP-dependent helicase/nuclease subunit A
LNTGHAEFDGENEKVAVIVNKTEHSSTHTPEMGTLYHTIMENIDFNLKSKEDVERTIDELIADGSIDGEMPIDSSVIVKALNNPLFDVARKGTCYREQPFIINVPAKEILDGVTTTDKVLVQGIIDLLVKDDSGEYVLIDYKYTGAREQDVRERYSEQIDLYTLAIEKIVGKKPVRRAIYIIGRDSVVEF